MRIKKVLRYDPIQKKLRLFRFMWEVGKPGYGGRSNKLAFSLVPKLIKYNSYIDGYRITLLGVSVHYRQSFGGIFV